MFATGVTMGLAKWIIDDTCLVIYYVCILFHCLRESKKSLFLISLFDGSF